MPRLTSSFPRYRLHKASGQAVVRLNGNEVYLGVHGTRTSKREYDRLIAEWLAGGRRLPSPQSEIGDLTIVEVLARFFRHAKVHYRKNGQVTHEVDNIKFASVPLKRLYGHTRLSDFGPIALKAVQKQMIDDGLCRTQVNSRIGRIKRIFRWAVSEQLCPPSVIQGLETVAGLQRGRTEARESKPVMSAPDNLLDEIARFLPSVVADMARFQRLAGCRPGEVCNLRPCDVDRSASVWKFRPASHKTEHHGQERVIFIGPRAQAILLPYLLRADDAFCFTPADSERRRKQQLRDNRKTKVQPSQIDRRKAAPLRRPTGQYSKDSYARALRRACDAAYPVPDGVDHAAARDWRDSHRWAPNQLRHAAATEIRKTFGLEAAQVVLGHSKADVTQIYAERNSALACQVMERIG